jgi:anti-sigma B factor antagonist
MTGRALSPRALSFRTGVRIVHLVLSFQPLRGAHASCAATGTGHPRMGSALSIHSEQDGGRHTLVLTGELDIASAPELEAEVKRICNQSPRELVLDLSRLEFIDSSGLRAVLRVRALCQEELCDFLLTPGARPVQHLFEITRLIDKLPFRRSRHQHTEDSPLPASDPDPDAPLG